MSVVYEAMEWLGHLIHEIIMGMLAFGSVAVLFASIVGVAIWIVRELSR